MRSPPAPGHAGRVKSAEGKDSQSRTGRISTVINRRNCAVSSSNRGSVGAAMLQHPVVRIRTVDLNQPGLPGTGTIAVLADLSLWKEEIRDAALPSHFQSFVKETQRRWADVIRESPRGLPGSTAKTPSIFDRVAFRGAACLPIRVGFPQHPRFGIPSPRWSKSCSCRDGLRGRAGRYFVISLRVCRRWLRLPGQSRVHPVCRRSSAFALGAPIVGRRLVPEGRRLVTAATQRAVMASQGRPARPGPWHGPTSVMQSRKSLEHSLL